MYYQIGQHGKEIVLESYLNGEFVVEVVFTQLSAKQCIERIEAFALNATVHEDMDDHPVLLVLQL